jgi:hypothetical protein
MMQLVGDWYIAREVNHDEGLTETTFRTTSS